jgi:hypothetical protein
VGVVTALTSPAAYRPAKGAWRRGLVAGTAWGVTFAAVMIGLNFWNCGVICIGDAAFVTALSVSAGLATMGPLAAFGRPA